MADSITAAVPAEAETRSGGKKTAGAINFLLIAGLAVILAMSSAVAFAAEGGGIAGGGGAAAEGAKQAPRAGGGAAGYMNFVILIGFVLIFYFLLIRPQRTQQKKRQEMIGALKVGDKVLTASGIYGEITEIKEKSLRVKIAKNVIVRMDRSGVNAITSKDENSD